MFSKYEAITLMNKWGGKRIPFIFIIDFEMVAIRLYRLDSTLPSNILYDFRSNTNINLKSDSQPSFTFFKFPMKFDDYRTAFDMVRKEILNGNSFLANLTFPTLIETDLSLYDIFRNSKAKYKLLVDGQFVCFSPESFIIIEDDMISTFPMKGTINALLPDAEKLILADPKESAEHSTIVDLLRNDLSMIAKDITVRQYRSTDRIKTHEGEIIQVSSEIAGKLPADFKIRLGEIIFTLLPAGSVTGAPKERTTAIIRKAEKTGRGYYTGICGIFDGTNVDSAVMIRFIEKQKDNLFFRSGGGITFLSDVYSEYHELIDKVYVPINRDNQDRRGKNDSSLLS